MLYIVKIGSKEYEVEVEKGQANIVKTTTITEQTAPVTTTVASPAAPAVSAVTTTTASAVPAEGEAIKAPMPGMIVDIKVNNGSSVKKGDILVVLEAMKMENELVAPIDGIVAQVLVAKGASVATNDVLIIIQ